MIRRGPVVTGPPHNTAGPNRWIPKIRVYGRDSARRGLLLAGLVIVSHPPHVAVAAVTSVRPKPVAVIGTNYHRNGIVNVTSHTHITVTPVTSVRPKIVLVPPDYRRRWLLRQTGATSKNKVRAAASVLVSLGNVLIAPVNIVESWESHFISRGWTTLQDQIDAGYPIYAQPTPVTGQYVEIFDFGSIISNIIATVNWNTIAVTGTVATNTSTIETSTNAITWSTPVVGTSVFAASLRYVRLTMNFVGSNDKALCLYFNLQCLLNVHREQDGGQVNVFAADVSGTVVSFNKVFKSIDTIVVTPLNTVEQTAIYDFAFPVNPTTFKILLYNAVGARIDGLVTWLARGIF